MSLYELKCPMCKGTIWMDPATGKVVDHKASDHQKADFGDFVKSRQNLGEVWDNKMRKAKDEEARRKAEWDAKFKQAKENPDALKGDGKPDIQWD